MSKHNAVRVVRRCAANAGRRSFFSMNKRLRTSLIFTLATLAAVALASLVAALTR
jgi:hypothetical protein